MFFIEFKSLISLKKCLLNFCVKVFLIKTFKLNIILTCIYIKDGNGT